MADRETQQRTRYADEMSMADVVIAYEILTYDIICPIKDSSNATLGDMQKAYRTVYDPTLRPEMYEHGIQLEDKFRAYEQIHSMTLSTGRYTAHHTHSLTTITTAYTELHNVIWLNGRMDARSFTLFPDLLPELQIKIWGLAVADIAPRLITFKDLRPLVVFSRLMILFLDYSTHVNTPENILWSGIPRPSEQS